MYYYLLKDIIKEFSEEKPKNSPLTDLVGIIKKILVRLRVPFIDSCCPPDSFSMPVRYNCETKKLEYLVDIPNNIYTQIPNINTSLVRLNESTKKLEYLNTSEGIWKEIPE